MPQRDDATAAIERIYRTEYGRVVASLVRRFGDIDIAEEAAGEALLAAVERWPRDGVPPNPGGWLTTTAGHRAIDRIRRESPRRQAPGGRHDREPRIPEPTGPVTDDLLRRLGRSVDARAAYDAAIAATGNPAERAYPGRRRGSLAP